ncbi:MAG: trehalose-phosphatase [Beutenbergiaceae bacterium]
MSTLRKALDRFSKQSSWLIALDFDGCLAPIVPHPDDARPLPQAAAALQRLAPVPNLQVALVSGRALESLVLVATPPPGTLLVGSHGAERGMIDDDGTLTLSNAQLSPGQQRVLAQATAVATEVIAPVSAAGAWLEQKPTAVVVHTRALPPQLADQIESDVLTATASMQLRALPGKRVVELCVVPTSKGIALDDLRASTGASVVLYAGDDVTDEDALARLRPGDVGVKVGPGTTAARFRVADPAAIAAMLTHLADLFGAGPAAA